MHPADPPDAGQEDARRVPQEPGLIVRVPHDGELGEKGLGSNAGKNPAAIRRHARTLRP
jgi:hypothetical protein